MSLKKIKNKNYQDLVIKNGKFVGKFNYLYQNFNDPWFSIKKNRKHGKLKFNLLINLFLNLVDKFKLKKCKIVEIGCGYPQITNELTKKKFDAYGIDISSVAIQKAKKKYPNLKKKLFCSDINNFKLYDEIRPNIYIMSEVTWYVLPKLKKFLKFFKKQKNSFLIHSLAIYDKGDQKYGTEYFVDHDSIKKYFKLNYIASGYIDDLNNDKSSFFVAKSDCK